MLFPFWKNFNFISYCLKHIASKADETSIRHPAKLMHLLVIISLTGYLKKRKRKRGIPI